MKLSHIPQSQLFRTFLRACEREVSHRDLVFPCLRDDLIEESVGQGVGLDPYGVGLVDELGIGNHGLRCNGRHRHRRPLVGTSLYNLNTALMSLNTLFIPFRV